ncbi:bifunctional glutamate N-acetyltransferase/amino-acid acetyltransferase ArgJ [Streptomyces sp. SCSIO 30461]|uniref:bifunctional glutamate N-acetyltransferase/amino-acid acetyltransferase ArgJ n=1 Tax=Streptomyces sp. SCSIO 30461 TaxID=3118085 RepID=UPI0030CF8E78
MAGAVAAPRGFLVHTASVGLGGDERDGGDDFAILLSAHPAECSAVFTRSLFAGPSIVVSRDESRVAAARGVVVTARNGNVANGPRGLRDARELRASAARACAVPETELLIASTGVIGRPYPMGEILAHLSSLEWPPTDDDGWPERAARAIMTTDTRPKTATERCGPATVLGIAKGVGMIEPDMATLLAFFLTDANIPRPALDAIFRRVVDATFNAVSVDTDTSIADMAAVFANGLAGPVDLGEFERSLHSVALPLAKMVARDGEGASKLIEVTVTGARDSAQAKRVAKAVVNSPLVKTGVTGGDPNWLRIAVAVGKCHDDTDIDADRVTIGIGGTPVQPAGPADRPERTERAIEEHLRGDEVHITVGLGIGDARYTAFGCDLGPGFLDISSRRTCWSTDTWGIGSRSGPPRP